MNEEIKVNIKDYIPWQKCPICDGEGKRVGSGTSTYDLCFTCHGLRMIPMYNISYKSIQDEAIAFAKWISERPITSFWLRSNDEQIKYYQQFKTEQDG